MNYEIKVEDSPYLDIINFNRVCPYCKSNLIGNTIGNTNTISQSHEYFYFRCPQKCINVMYDRFDFDWINIKIQLAPYRTITIDKRFGKNIKFWLDDYKIKPIEFPLFDVFSYSLSDLEKKLNQYLVYC